MENLFDLAFIEAKFVEITAWANTHIFLLSTVIQLTVVLIAFLIAGTTAARFRVWLEKGWDAPWYDRFVRPITQALAPLSLPVIWLALQWF